MNTARGGSWDDEADGEQFDESSVFEAFAAYVPTDEENGSIFDTLGSNADEGVTTVTFTAPNPEATVWVTALMDGRVLRIELAPKVTSMTENELAEEITMISRLATQQALAGQHLVIAALMQRLGQDSANTRSFLQRELHLPTPEDVAAERARVFADRYAQLVEDVPRQ